MSYWQNLMPSAALAPGDVVAMEWQGEDLLIYRTAAGECRAISAYCPHMGNYIPNGLAPGQALSELLQQDHVRCPFHGWCFNGEGQCVDIPQGQRVPAAVKQGRAVIRYWCLRDHDQTVQISGSRSS